MSELAVSDLGVCGVSRDESGVLGSPERHPRGLDDAGRGLAELLSPEPPAPAPLHRIMASLRNLVIAILRTTDWDNLAEATRHHARDINRPIRALLQA